MLTQPQMAFSASCTTMPVKKAGGAQKVGKIQAGQLILTAQRDIPFHTVPWWAYKAGGRRQGGCSEWWPLSSHITTMCDGALTSWGWLNTCQPTGTCECIPHFVLFVGATFGSTAFNSTQAFFWLLPLIPFSVPLGESEEEAFLVGSLGFEHLEIATGQIGRG